MTNNFNPLDLQGFGMYAGKLVGSQVFTANERQWIGSILGRLASMPQAPGLPGAPSGDKRGDNTLRRTNWFNGRYLTAEALSRQDVYFDHRSRLNAQALMPGIAWGLGLEFKAVNKELTLQQGLAFDGIGRPILVSEPFRFLLNELMGEAQKTPRMVVGGQREFMPCVCLAPDPNGPSGSTAALPPGTYLLVIEAGEKPTGKAKVTGDLCGGRASDRCDADAWMGGFGLSLVRFPVDVPLPNGNLDAWALRGTLSAYYFDVFEHSLLQRWEPTFPINDLFGTDSDPKRHEGMAIPLALLHLQPANGVLFLDQWIPRRMICATPGEDWHRLCFGAPPRAAAWARIHQFQTMLEESLAERPIDPDPDFGNDLLTRGFRTIPPIGFLPVVVADVAHLKYCTDFSSLLVGREHEYLFPYAGNHARFYVCEPQQFFALLQVGATQANYSNESISISKSGLIKRSRQTCFIELAWQANEIIIERADINPITVQAYGEHPELTHWVLLKTVQNSASQTIRITSDSVSVDRQNWTGIKYVVISVEYETAIKKFSFRPDGNFTTREALQQAEEYFEGTNVILYGVVALHDDDILEDLNNVIDKDPIQLMEYRSRDSENPMVRLRDSADKLVCIHPGFSFAASRSFSLVLFFEKLLEFDDLVNRRIEMAKIVVPMHGLSRFKHLVAAMGAHSVAVGAGQQEGEVASIDRLPRQFVVYVKQRIVLLDVLYLIIDILKSLSWPEWLKSTYGTSYSFAQFTKWVMEPTRTGVKPTQLLLIRTALANPLVQPLLIRAMAATTPLLARKGTFLKFQQQMERISGESSSIPEPGRQEMAAREVAAIWAAEWPEAQVLQLFTAVLTPQQSLDLLQQLEAWTDPSRQPIVADSLNLQLPDRFTSPTSRELYAEARQQLQQRPLKDLVKDLSNLGEVGSLTVGDLLIRNSQEANRILGGPDKVEGVVQAFLQERQDALEAAEALADGAPPDVVTKVEAAVAAGEQPAAALRRLKDEEQAKPQPNEALVRKISSAETLLRVSGNRIETLAPLRRADQR